MSPAYAVDPLDFNVSLPQSPAIAGASPLVRGGLDLYPGKRIWPPCVRGAVTRMRDWGVVYNPTASLRSPPPLAQGRLFLMNFPFKKAPSDEGAVSASGADWGRDTFKFSSLLSGVPTRHACRVGRGRAAGYPGFDACGGPRPSYASSDEKPPLSKGGGPPNGGSGGLPFDLQQSPSHADA